MGRNSGTFAYLGHLSEFHKQATKFITEAFETYPTLQQEILKQIREILIQQYKPILLDPQNQEGLYAMLTRDDDISR